MSDSDHTRPDNTPGGIVPPDSQPQQFDSEWERDVAAREQRKLKARAEVHRTIWFGLGTFGLVGWSVTLPALAGIATGIWIDHRFPSRFSWTLMLLVLGVALGCLNAWRWVSRESQSD